MGDGRLSTAGGTPARLLRGGGFFEAPRWRDGRWWVSDFYRHAAVTATPDGAEERMVEVAAQPSGLGWMPDGSMLVVSMRDHRVLRVTPSGETTVHPELGAHCGDALGGRRIRVAPGGVIVDEVRAPAGLGVFACMPGGDDGRTLLLCGAPAYVEHLRRDAREAVLLTTTVEVPHAGLP